MQTTLQKLEKIIEKNTGCKVSDLRDNTIDENRIILESKGIKIRFYSAFPFIGRGSITREFISHEEVNQIVDKSIE